MFDITAFPSKAPNVQEVVEITDSGAPSGGLWSGAPRTTVYLSLQCLQGQNGRFIPCNNSWCFINAPMDGCDNETQKLKFMIEYECVWYFKDWNCEAATQPRYIGYTFVSQHPGLGGARHLRRQLLEIYGVARKPNEIDVPYIYIYIYKARRVVMTR